MFLPHRLLLIIIGAFFIIHISCGEKEMGFDCGCNSNQVCFAGECYPREWAHELGGQTVIARNSYIGILQDQFCIDTLIFFDDTTRSLNDDRFGLLVVHKFFGGIRNVAGSLPHMISPTEFGLYTAAALCFLNGDEWGADFHFKLHKDSVLMDFKFWAFDGNPSGIVDSCSMVFYRNY